LWAGATDFDLWRQYGYKVETKQIPFITDSETMGKPYAILELIVAASDINSGNISVIGNEFYQPGDIVYIASRNLLYYVVNVTHRFDYSGGNFSTDLSLKYGRPPGVYLPSPMDILGQQALGTADSKFITYRTARSDDNYIPLSPESTLIIPKSIMDGSSTSKEIDLLSFGTNNLRFTQMMSQLSTGFLSGERYLLIRGFAKNKNNSSEIEKINNSLSVIRSIFQNPIQVVKSTNDIINFSSTKYVSQQMSLPNSRLAPSIPGDKIIEQISYLEKSSTDQTTIKCLDRKLDSIINSRGINIQSNNESGSIEDIFPKDGPRQRSWVDIRDRLFDFSENFTIVEIGIITIPAKIR
jgi:hypothetical protein